MKALTLTQPWATLVVRGVKRFETRDWKYDPRRPEVDPSSIGAPLQRVWYVSELPITLAIHAAKGQSGADVRFAEWLRDVPRVLDTADLPLGAIVGTVRYVCWHYSYPDMRAELKPSPIELEVGDWSDGRILWQLEDPVEFERPVPARGAQRIWNWRAPDFVGLERAVAEAIGR